MFRALATLCAGLLAASCLLFVSPEDYGERCKFAGEETACGRCLRERCQPSIDACCKDEGCSPTLAALESCATHADATESRCGELGASAARPGSDGELATCATTRCAAVCRAFTGTSATRCSEPDFGRGATCACTSAPESGQGNDFECSPQSYPGTVCCAPPSWPADGIECTCLPLGCHKTPEGCSCALVDTPPEQTSCTAPPCCASTVDPDQCVCRATCFDIERAVPSCSVTAQVGSVAVIGCKKGQKRVASCTIRTPQ